jgi:DNA polymerase III sliding clamp (beta) subunit (PCNA family)
MIKISEIRADLDSLLASQVKKAGTTDPLLMGVMVNRQGELCTLTTFDGISSTTITERDWGQSIPEGGFVLPAAFANLIRTLDKEAEVTIEKVKTGQVQVKQGSSKWRFPMSLQTESFYPMGEEILSNRVACTSIQFESDLLREAILNVFPSIGKEYTALCCAQFIIKPKVGELIAIANDGKRSTAWKAVAVNVKYPDLPLPEYQFILPGTKLLALAKFLKDTEKVEVHFTDSLAIFENVETKTSVTIRLLDGKEYPQVLKLFTIPFVTGYSLAPKEFLTCLKRIKILLPENKLGAINPVDLRFENDRVKITNKSDLFTEILTCKNLEIEGVENPSVFESRLNFEYINGALSILTGKECDMKLHSNIVSVASTTLMGSVTHFIATVAREEN